MSGQNYAEEFEKRQLARRSGGNDNRRTLKEEKLREKSERSTSKRKIEGTSGV